MINWFNFVSVFMHHFSRKIHMLLHRENVFLVSEDSFSAIFEQELKKNPEVSCFNCGKKLTTKNVQGWVTKDKQLLFFCDDVNCRRDMGK